MGKLNLRQRIGKGTLLLDGGMGTQLMARGIEPGICNENLNLEFPDIITEIHRSYIEAGSDAVLTNTFGANRYALARHGLDDMVREINIAAVKLARKAAGSGRYVLGDIGPSGDFLEPLGNLTPGGLKDDFVRQAAALAEGGVDGFIIETMSALGEAQVAVAAVKSITKLPVMVSLSFDSIGNDFKTMMGVGVESIIGKMLSMGVDVVGFNCGRIPIEEYVLLADRYASAVKSANSSAAILAEPNAGVPDYVDGKTVYNVLPEDFAVIAKKIQDCGVSIIGGCCGTTPAHIAAMARILRQDCLQ